MGDNESFVGKARRMAGFTQEGMGRKIGVTQGRYAQYEADPTCIPARRIRSIYRALDGEAAAVFASDYKRYFFN